MKPGIWSPTSPGTLGRTLKSSWFHWMRSSLYATDAEQMEPGALEIVVFRVALAAGSDIALLQSGEDQPHRRNGARVARLHRLSQTLAKGFTQHRHSRSISRTHNLARLRQIAVCSTVPKPAGSG